MTTLAQLKKSNSNFDRLNAELEKIKTKPKFEKKVDERFYSVELDEAGNGFAELRFLPASPQDEENSLPWVSTYTHGFPGPKGKKGPWYIENSLSTLGKDHKDPVGEYNSKLWKTEKKVHRDYVSQVTKRRLNYFTNVLVVNDPKNPQNNGKVFIFKIGKMIFEFLNEAMHPTLPGEVPYNPFDLWNGANLKLSITRVGGFANYDKSKLGAQGPVAKSDAEIEAIWNKTYSLKEFVAPDQFKTYDELKKKLDDVLGFDTAKWEDGVVAAPVAAVNTNTKPSSDIEEIVIEDEDDDMSRFSKLT